MSSEYATEQVPLAEIQEGDTVQIPSPGSGSPSPERQTHNECHHKQSKS